MPKPAIGASGWGATLNAYFEERFPVSVKDHGADPAASGAVNAAAFTAALAAVSSGGCVVVPAGTYAITGNVTIASDNVTLRGVADATYLDFAGGGIVVDGTTGYTTEIGIHDISLRRTGAAGPALRFKGAGSGTGVSHFNVSNVRVRSSTGEGLLIDGSYIGTFTGCYWIGCSTYGIKIAADGTTGLVFGNNISFFGGETQGCVNAASLSAPTGVNFYGHAFEGSTTSGVELPTSAYAAGFYGCYFESNVGYDIKIGTTAMCYNVTVHGCIILDGTSAKTNSIIGIRSRALTIEGTTFNGYGGPPVKIQEASAGDVMGYVRNCWDGGFQSIVELNGATKFDKSYLGYYGSAGIAQHYAASAVLDFGSIAAHTTADLTMTVTGVAVGDDVSCHSTNLETGLMPYSSVTATDTVTIRLANITASAIDPPARTWRVRVWR